MQACSFQPASCSQSPVFTSSLSSEKDEGWKMLLRTSSSLLPR